jgi:hypothetical protein
VIASVAFQGRDLRWGALAALLVLAGNVAYVAAHMGSVVHKPKHVLETDHYRYIEMAKGREGRAELAHQPPYCWRVLVPWMAGRMAVAGVDLNLAFWIITNLSLFAFLLVTFLYLRQLGFALPTALLGIALTGLIQGAVRWFEYQYWMTDPTSLFLLMLAVYGIRAGWTAPLAVIGILAALVRETSISVFVLYFLRECRSRPILRTAVRTALLAALPVATLVIVRVLVPANQSDSLWSGIEDTMGFRIRHWNDNQLYVLTVGSWGVLCPLVLLFPGRLLALMRRQIPEVVYLVIVYGTLLIGNCTERLVAYALPVTLPAALVFFETLVAESRVSWRVWAAAVLGAQGVFYVCARFAGEPGVSMYQPTSLPVVATMAIFWLSGIAVLARRSRAHPTHSA